MIEILESRVAPATLIWLGNSGGLWSSAANWDGGTTPASGDTLIFNDSGGTAAMTNDTAPGSEYHLVFTGTTHPYTLIGAPIALAAGGGLDDASAASVEIANVLIGAGGVNQGGGSLKLSGVSSFTGAINISGGILHAFGSATTMNSTTSVLGNPQVPNRAISIGVGGTLEFSKSDVFGIDGTIPQVELFIAGTVTNVAGKFNSLGEVHLTSGGVLTGLGGASTAKQMYALTGDITSNGGTISGSGGNAGYHISDGIIFKPDTAPLIVSAVLLNTSPGNSLIPATPEPSTLTVFGNDAIWLTATNKFSGGVAIQDGTVRIKSNLSLGTAAGEVSIADGGTLAIAPDAANSTMSARVFTLSGEASFLIPGGKSLALTGVVQDGSLGGTVNVSGGGKLTLSNQGNSFSNGAIIDGSKLRIASNLNLGAPSGDITLRAGGSLEVSSTLTTSRDFTLEGLGRFSIPGGKTLTVTGVVEDGATVPGSIAVTGGGTLVLSNAGNAFSGPYTVSNSAMAVNGVTFKLSGPGTGIITPLAGATGIESIVMSGTTLATTLKVSSATTGGLPAIPLYRISIPSATDHIKSINLRSSTIVFGDGAADTLPDLFIAGKVKSIGLVDVNPGALIKLGSGLPYNVVADETTPDTYNNKPNITINDILGPEVRISVLGDGSVGGVGGGGLGKVRVHRWSPEGTTPPPQPSGGLAGDPPPTDYEGVIETTQTIDLIEIQDGDSDVTVYADSDGVGAVTTAHVLEILCNNGDWKSPGSRIEGRLGKFTVRDFSGSIDVGGEVGEEIGMTIKEFKVTGKFSGQLTASAIKAISAGNITGLDSLNKARITATNGNIGTIKTTAGNIQNTLIQSFGNIGDITLAGAGSSINTSKILAGVNVGIDGEVGGIDDTFADGTTIGNVTIPATMTGSVIAASIMPNLGGYDGPFGGDTNVGIIGGSIGTVKLNAATLDVLGRSEPLSGLYTNLIIAKVIAGAKVGTASKIPTATDLSNTGKEFLFSATNLLFASVS